jgi:hypothetical protein
MPFRANCRRNLQIACIADTVGNIPLGEHNLKFKKWRQFLIFSLPSTVFNNRLESFAQRYSQSLLLKYKRTRFYAHTKISTKNAVQEFHLRLEMRACCLCCDDCVRWDQNCRVWVSCALLQGAGQYKAAVFKLGFCVL